MNFEKPNMPPVEESPEKDAEKKEMLPNRLNRDYNARIEEVTESGGPKTYDEGGIQIRFRREGDHLYGSSVNSPFPEFGPSGWTDEEEVPTDDVNSFVQKQVEYWYTKARESDLK